MGSGAGSVRAGFTPPWGTSYARWCLPILCLCSMESAISSPSRHSHVVDLGRLVGAVPARSDARSLSPGGLLHSPAIPLPGLAVRPSVASSPLSALCGAWSTSSLTASIAACGDVEGVWSIQRSLFFLLLLPRLDLRSDLGTCRTLPSSDIRFLAVIRAGMPALVDHGSIPLRDLSQAHLALDRANRLDWT